MRRPGLFIAVLLLTDPVAADPPATTGGPAPGPVGSVTAPAGQPVPDDEAHDTTPVAPAKVATPVFGAPDSEWLTLSTGIAKDFDESTDFNLSVSWSRFIVQDVEFGVEAAAWYFDQENDPALGLNGTPFLRWHFVAHETWSLFTDAGIGLCVTTDDVPEGGTSFTFTPRAGFGATIRLAEDDTRLEVGIRWQHFSNARITGDEANPGRDEPMLYVGVIFPF